MAGVFLLGTASPPAVADAGDGQKPTPAAPAAGTSVRQFPQNLGRNFLALFDTRNIAPFLVGGAASGGVAFFDHQIRDGWGVENGSTLMGSIGSAAGGPVVIAPAVAGLFILGHFSRSDRFRSFSYSMAQAEVLDMGLVEGLKVTLRRGRPDGSDNHSFPSGHAASSFSIATVAAHYYGWRAGVIGYGAAAFIAASRSRENKHWASDLTAGATIGYIVGASVSRRTGICLRVKKVVLLPSIDLRHKTIGLTLWRISD